MLKGFFAYPNQASISEAVAAFAKKINTSGIIEVKIWEEMKIGGKVLVPEICKEIDECDIFFADITQLNPNVLFEIGYAIAKKKRIWLIRDSSMPALNADFKQFKVLTTLGYREYINSDHILTAFYQDKPFESLGDTVYDNVVAPAVRYDVDQHVLYLKSHYEVEASVKITQFLDDNFSRNKYPLMVDDPVEEAIQPLGWYATNVHAAQAVICHLTAIDRADSKIQNAKHSLVAGMAHGFDVRVLLLIEGSLFGPADYKELLFNYNRTKDAVARVEKFIQPVLTAKRELRVQRQHAQATARNIDELASLKIGEPIAEHEEDSLSDQSFVETAPYHAAIDGSQTIFVGRKGVGKTANFKRIAKVLGKDRRIVVCEIKPLSYELEALLSVAKRFETLSKRGFLFESLWKFLIYSELAKQTVEDIYARPSGEIVPQERELVTLVESKASLLKLDFSARLDKLSSEILSSSLEDRYSNESNIAVSELLHSGIIKNLIDALLPALGHKVRIVVLVDNLDKAWDRSENTKFLCYFFLGLLSASRRVTNDFKNRPVTKESIRASLCVFVRADIFEMVLQQAREPDKIQYQRITWDDKERLRLLADNRIIAAVGKSEPIPVEAIWNRFFVQTIHGTDLFTYLFGFILPRPRDLLFFLRASLISAVNKRHEKVQEIDLLKAAEDYSEFAYQAILVELREKIPSIEDVLTQFMGINPSMSEPEVRTSLQKILSLDEEGIDNVISSLVINSFLEIHVPTKGYTSVGDEKDYKRFYRAARAAAERSKIAVMFRVHRAFWNVLFIGDMP